MLHEILKMLRESKGLDVESLADQLRLRPFLIEGIESERIVPTERILEIYSKHFGLPAKSLNLFFDVSKESALEWCRFFLARFLFKRIKKIYG
ncbi:helix-turn-helix domain-containing protein [Comamonas kerstersii]|uniref:helix-turn-helix domain-containing protein n=1 Tax=Comamonas kerstersii TaxID=225992 RepID=UPI00345D987F